MKNQCDQKIVYVWKKNFRIKDKIDVNGNVIKMEVDHSMTILLLYHIKSSLHIESIPLSIEYFEIFAITPPETHIFDVLLIMD